MKNLFYKISIIVVVILGLILTISNHIKQKEKSARLFATNSIETPVALFSTTLANSITSSATTMTLTSATTKDGTTLASSTYSFIIDEGTASEEFVKADCTATACTNMSRGISVITGTTTVSSLQKAHRRGASVKITDAPILLNVTRILNGIGQVPNALTYASGVTMTPGSNQIASVSYVDATANAGASTSTESNGGIVELGTASEQASSYNGGASKPTVLQTKYSTSTPGSPQSTNANYNIIADATGYLKQTWLNLTEVFAFSGNNTFSGTQTFSGQNTFSATTTLATTTFNGVNFNNSNVLSLTAGETITGGTTPVPVMLATSTNRVFIVDANVASTTNFIGYAINTSATAGTVYVQTSGLVKGFTGLTGGLRYYVSDTAGTIGTSVGTSEIYAGTAISSTQISLDYNDSGNMQYLGSQSISCTPGSSGVVTSVNQLWARHALVVLSGTNGGALSHTGDVWISKVGKTTATIAHTDSSGGDPVSMTVTWTASTMKITADSSASDTACTITAYYYR